jgi:hypothetical protein
MNGRKSLFLEIAEVVDRRLRQRARRDDGVPPAGRRLGWLRWLGRQMVPNVGTLLMVVVLLLTVPSLAAPLRAPAATSTSTISYQGRLADSSGDPLTGKYNLEFRIYDVPTGGVPLWTEMWTGANAVGVSDGLFNVMLGSIDNTLASAIEGHEELYLGITVGTDNEMEPRVQLGSVPFSMQAMTVADGSITTEKIADGAVTQPLAVSSSMVASTSSTSFVDLPGRSITLTTSGGAVLVMFSGSHRPGEVGVVGYWQIIRDDSVVVAYNNHAFVSSIYEWTTTTLLGMDTPLAGEHTYKVQWRVSQGTLSASEGTYSENFAAVEFKR